jgi:hypothetical protein
MNEVLSNQIADAVERLYAALPAVHHEAIDTLRDEIANALGIAGLASSSSFITRARTIKKTERGPA